MASYFGDNADLGYYLRQGIRWRELLPLLELDQREGGAADAAEAVQFYQEVAQTVGELAANDIAPHAAEIDRQGVEFVAGEARFPARLQSIFDKIAGLGLHALHLPRELGGMNVPLVSYLVNCELLARADISVMAHYAFHTGPA